MKLMMRFRTNCLAPGSSKTNYQGSEVSLSDPVCAGSSNYITQIPTVLRVIQDKLSTGQMLSLFEVNWFKRFRLDRFRIHRAAKGR